jgi:hypothetical protein
MKNNVEILTEIPCFECLFWDWKKESHLYCNPNECEKLTKWLLEQVEDDKTGLTVGVDLKECGPVARAGAKRVKNDKAYATKTNG